MLSVINFEHRHLRHSTHRNWDYSNSALLLRASAPAPRTPTSFYSNPFYYSSRCSLIFYLNSHVSHIRAFSISAYHSFWFFTALLIRLPLFSERRLQRLHALNTPRTLDPMTISRQLLASYLALSFARALSLSLSRSRRSSVDQVFFYYCLCNFRTKFYAIWLSLLGGKKSWSGKARKKRLVFYALLSPMMEIRRDSISQFPGSKSRTLHTSSSTFINLLQPSCICNAKLF